MTQWRAQGVVTINVVAFLFMVAGSALAGESPAPSVPAPGSSVVLGAAAAKPHRSGPDNISPSWANNSMTGYCGQTDGGYDVAAQLLLRAYGSYTGLIDNYWGSKSHSALIAYQREDGTLEPDGCAGPKTWADMQAGLVYIGDSSECEGSGVLKVYRYARGGRVVHYDRSSRTSYWYGDAYLQPTGGPVRERLYRFSDNLVAYC
ncbi:MAG: hypothetical protein QOE45_11 [Frankiaceae bacterium]|jgi:hypothetical protein|nr:hypothetical protein [Frankiaceae bacterium]